jgi:hypothetical protein
MPVRQIDHRDQHAYDTKRGKHAPPCLCWVKLVRSVTWHRLWSARLSSSTRENKLGFLRTATKRPGYAANGSLGLSCFRGWVLVLAAETREHPDEERGEGAEIVVRRRHFTHVPGPFELARALSRTSNVNRCISVRHDSGRHWARPPAAPSSNRKHCRRCPLAGPRGRSLRTNTARSVRRFPQTPVLRLLPAS